MSATVTEKYPNYSPGLEGIIAGISTISEIDAANSRLEYRGYNVHDLAENGSFEETAYLLIFDKLPNKKELEDFRNTLAAEREVPSQVYDALKATEGVEYVGSVSQPALAERLAYAHVLAYPNIFPETSCIAVMEALAAGLYVVTSDLAALPETSEGFARLVPVTFGDEAKHARDYGAALADLSPAYDVDARWKQVVHMNRNHTWSVRARQWTEFLNAA